MEDQSIRETDWDSCTHQEVRRGPGLGVTIRVVAAVGSLAAVTLLGQFQNETSTALLTLDVATAVASCALLPVLLRWPVAGALALAALASMSPAATPAATVGTLHVAHRRRFELAVAVAAAGIAAHAARGLLRPVDGISYGWWLVLVGVAHAALLGWGAWTRARHALVASLRERARRAEAEQGRRVAEARGLERTRIAREMHDVLAHRLSLLATYAGALEYRPDAPPEQLTHAAGVIRLGAHEALDELREVIGLLRDDEAVAPDSSARPLPVLTDLARLIEESREAGTDVALDNQVADSGALPAAASRTAYRVVQEGLTNARKHAAGQPVAVTLVGAPGTRLMIEIRNPLPPDRFAAPLVPGTGTGLVGLSERVQLASGQLDHHETAAGEFRLHAWLPWPG